MICGPPLFQSHKQCCVISGTTKLPNFWGICKTVILILDFSPFHIHLLIILWTPSKCAWEIFIIRFWKINKNLGRICSLTMAILPNQYIWNLEQCTNRFLITVIIGTTLSNTKCERSDETLTPKYCVLSHHWALVKTSISRNVKIKIPMFKIIDLSSFICYPDSKEYLSIISFKVCCEARESWRKNTTSSAYSANLCSREKIVIPRIPQYHELLLPGFLWKCEIK